MRERADPVRPGGCGQTQDRGLQLHFTMSLEHQIHSDSKMPPEEGREQLLGSFT